MRDPQPALFARREHVLLVDEEVSVRLYGCRKVFDRRYYVVHSG